MIDRDDVLVEIGGKKYIPDSLKSVCRWWIATYPEDIFVENPKEVVEIRERMKKLLQQLAKKYNHLFVSRHHPFFVDEVIVLKEAIKDIVSDPETKRRIYNRASELMAENKQNNGEKGLKVAE
ncbi:hypothetical protein KAW18_18675 [candidate division WOR-3 bacterium]|nr:hypothetical protein [candidate division WOR-3 bacterium]